MKKFFVSVLFLALGFNLQAANAATLAKYYKCENPERNDFYFKIFQADSSKGLLRAGVSYGRSGSEFSDSFILDGARFENSSDELTVKSTTKGPSYNDSRSGDSSVNQHYYETTLKIKGASITGHIKLRVDGKYSQVKIDEDITCEASEKPLYDTQHYFYDCGPKTWLRMQSSIGFGDKHFFVVNSKVFRVDRFSIGGRPVFNNYAGFLNMQSPDINAEQGTFFIPLADLSDDSSKVRLMSYPSRVVSTGEEPHDNYSCTLTIM